jgi:hypothetical protein
MGRHQFNCLGILLGVVLAPVLNVRAEWSWAETEVTAVPSGEQMVATFTFHNKGNKPITITELKFSCSCTDYSFKATTADSKGTGVVRIFLSRSDMEETRELVAFGPQETVPTLLTIRIPKTDARDIHSTRTTQ